jgi:hypothetical protein
MPQWTAIEGPEPPPLLKGLILATTVEPIDTNAGGMGLTLPNPIEWILMPPKTSTAAW